MEFIDFCRDGQELSLTIVKAKGNMPKNAKKIPGTISALFTSSIFYELDAENSSENKMYIYIYI